MTVFTTKSWMFDQDCDRMGMNRALRSGALVRLRRGVVMPAEDLPVWQLHRRRMDAAALTINHGTYFAFQSAALLHGLPVRIVEALPVQVVRTLGGRHTRNRLLQATPAVLDDADIAIVDGLPATGLHRTVTDLARRLPFPDAVAVVDAALRRGLDRHGLATPSGYGHARAARAVAFGDGASESFGESHSRARMALANIPIPQLQVEQFTADGRFLGRPDFDWGDGIIGEYDGGSKYDGTYGDEPRTVIEAEKLRQQAFMDEGYTVIRWGWKELQSPGVVEGRIRRALAGRPFRRAQL
ncbi:MAG: hypothetical protein QM619_05290 [Micropruina sp.]|uniref:hypothetical protein n=1 Tax=Micropruina sp. TaxID=2737536 RepID=UPI0039E395F8